MTTEKQTKTCIKCGRELPTSEYNKCSSRPDGLQPMCRECQAKYNKERLEKKQANKFSFGNPELAKFKPRELIEELRVRGYKGRLTYTQVIEL